MKMLCCDSCLLRLGKVMSIESDLGLELKLCVIFYFMFLVALYYIVL